MALPVPIPGPLDPAPVTIATLPSSLGRRSGMMFPFLCAKAVRLAWAPWPAGSGAGGGLPHLPVEHRSLSRRSGMSVPLVF
jgi:hypothetical protein